MFTFSTKESPYTRSCTIRTVYVNVEVYVHFHVHVHVLAHGDGHEPEQSNKMTIYFAARAMTS
jgi:hypothetical protein